MINGTLANRLIAGFEPTPSPIAEIIAANLLTFPQNDLQTIAVLEPTIGVGDLAAPFTSLPGFALVGIEQDPDRAAQARSRFPHAQIITAELEQVALPNEAFSLILANFPYGTDVEFGFRLEYLMLKQVTAALAPGGVLVTIVPARSGWDDMTIAYMGKRYEHVRAWRFFEESEDEGQRFSTFTQMVVCGVRRVEPLVRTPDEIATELKGWRFNSADGAFRGTPPPELPHTPITHPYLVPTVQDVPHMQHKAINEADLVAAAHVAGVYTTVAWASATETSDRARAPRPLMRYSRTAHIVGGFFTGFLDGVPISADGRTMVFSSFMTKVKAKRTLDDAEIQEELAKGAVSVQVFRDEPKFFLTALDLNTGVTTFAANDEAQETLRPFLTAIADLVVADQPPIYDPTNVEPWMLRATTAIGAQKRLPGAPHPGLAPAQLHMSFALHAALGTLGFAAEQGKPGTGKTLTTINTMALLATQYRHRPTNIVRTQDDGQVAYQLVDMQKTLCEDEVRSFVGQWEVEGEHKRWINRSAPGWIKKLRAAWRHHPHLADAGPQALPLFITCPKRVTRSAWEREIKTAWPQAEVIQVGSRTDLDRVFVRASVSASPAVIGIIPHSLTRAFTLTVLPDVTEDSITVSINDLSDNAAERGEPVLDKDERVLGYRDPETGDLLKVQQSISVFRCPTCGQIITAPLPGAEDESEEGPVEDIEWFERQKRTCTNTVVVHRHIDPDTGIDTGRPVTRECGTPLWKTVRVHSDPDSELNFAQWSQAVSRKRSWHGLTYDPRYSRLARNKQGEAINLRIHTDEDSPFDTLLREYRNCYALMAIDESHNAVGENTDVSRSFHHAQCGSLMHLYLSGTHYAGTMERFFFYWFRYNPRFWLQFGFKWQDAATACSTFGVIETWVREYEGKANKSTGAVQNRTNISSRLAPGIDASLFPYLLANMGFLTIADIGAMMPKRREYPHLVSMRDSALDGASRKSAVAYMQARTLQEAAKQKLADDPDDDQAKIALVDATTVFTQAEKVRREFEQWRLNRDLGHSYHDLDTKLTDMAKNGIAAAALGKGSLLRWYPTLCMDRNPFSITRVLRTTWGKVQGYNTIITAPCLAEEYVYPLERELRKVVHQELKEGRRVMIYIEQAGKRDLHARLAKILAPIARHYRTGVWSLTNDVASTEREAAICSAVEAGNLIITVPYRLVSEGVNLQGHIDTIVWYEMARNRFSQDQASERAYRLGRPIDPTTGLQRDVRLHFLAYAGTAGHTKLRKLAGENVAAQLFDGDTPGGELAAWSGAMETPIARMSASLDEQQQSLAEAFARRDALRDTLLNQETEAQQADVLAIRLAQAWKNPTEAQALWGVRPPRVVQAHVSRSELVFGSKPGVSKKSTRGPKASPDTGQVSLFDFAGD